MHAYSPDQMPFNYCSKISTVQSHMLNCTVRRGGFMCVRPCWHTLYEWWSGKSCWCQNRHCPYAWAYHLQTNARYNVHVCKFVRLSFGRSIDQYLHDTCRFQLKAWSCISREGRFLDCRVGWKHHRAHIRWTTEMNDLSGWILNYKSKWNVLPI